MTTNVDFLKTVREASDLGASMAALGEWRLDRPGLSFRDAPSVEYVPLHQFIVTHFQKLGRADCLQCPLFDPTFLHFQHERGQ
jgi:hypothetical protein